MRSVWTTLATALAVTLAAAEDVSYLGFNSGANLLNGTPKSKADYVQEMKAALALQGSPGTFNVFRLYTCRQPGSETDPIAAFEAAMETGTKLLLGIWASGTDTIKPELDALQNAVKQYGSRFTDTVIGMSVGSEDLYRNSVVGVKNKAGLGTDPDTIVRFINDYKTAFKGQPLGSVPIGHVDTWDAWTNGTARALLDAVDFLGVDEYPYYEDGKNNGIEEAGRLFDAAFGAVEKVAGEKPIWMTETGWPVSGPTWDKAEATPENAGLYWREIGCRRLFGKMPIFWYTLRDANPENKMQFSIVDGLDGAPRFNLTCPDASELSAGNQASSKDASNDGKTNKTGSGSGSGSSSTTNSPHSNTADSSKSSETKKNSGSHQTIASSFLAAAIVLSGATLLL